MSIHTGRLAALRAELASRGLDGFIVPLTDEHMSEYVGNYARRLEWLTGFQGSAGSAAVLASKAAVFVDGRYTVQVRAQVNGDLFEYRSVPAEPLLRWLADTAPAGARIGYDPWLTTRAFVAAATAAGVALVPVGSNPVDTVWADRPQPSLAAAEALGEAFAGRSSADKRAELAATLRTAGAGSVILSALDSIAWLFNIRGADVPRTPVVRAFAIVGDDGRATLFTGVSKISAEVRHHLGPDVAIQPYEAFGPALRALSGKVMLDPAWSVAAITEALAHAGAEVVEARDPCTIPKSAKNVAELDGMRAAHVRDGAAVAKFLHSIDARPPADEQDASDRLESFRRESNLLKDLSFDSISALG
ncbi:MAG: aminopeptidase P family N-terminal domain-containing protein, partial [Sandaracinobacteroides sp.]